LRAGALLDAGTAAAIRRQAALEGCKWDSQVGDVTTLAPFPLVMKRQVWNQLGRWAEQLAAEAAEAELEISGRPEFLRRLGLPRELQKALLMDAPFTPAAGRVIRFDFHPTTDGWRISEANSDVPGGFSEGSHFTALMAGQFPAFEPAGNPGQAWAEALAAAAGPGGVVALLSAPGYLEDHQVVSFLAARLREQGGVAHLAQPAQIRWRNGSAHLHAAWHRGPLDAIVRFYQAEWLPRLTNAIEWQRLFRGGRTPVANPALAVISESKRFPLVWDELRTGLPTWRALLPETRRPQEVRWAWDDAWLVKAAFSNTGDTVSLRELMTPKQWFQTRWTVALSPSRWIAQKRFESVPVTTPFGRLHACVGIFTVNGRAAGAYARLAGKPLMDFAAVDAALLIEDND
jgi:hypothetical protein